LGDKSSEPFFRVMVGKLSGLGLAATVGVLEPGINDPNAAHEDGRHRHDKPASAEQDDLIEDAELFRRRLAGCSRRARHFFTWGRVSHTTGFAANLGGTTDQSVTEPPRAAPVKALYRDKVKKSYHGIRAKSRVGYSTSNTSTATLSFCLRDPTIMPSTGDTSEKSRPTARTI